MVIVHSELDSVRDHERRHLGHDGHHLVEREVDLERSKRGRQPNVGDKRQRVWSSPSVRAQ